MTRHTKQTAIDDLTPELALKYFRARLGREPRKQAKEGEYRTNCPWHEDRSPSLHISTKKKTFNCFACGANGGILKFEMDLMGADKQTSLQRIGEITGESLLQFSRVEPDFIWSYRDEDGKELYQVLRYNRGDGGKRIQQRKPGKDGEWVYDLNEGLPVRRVLYNLQDVLTSRYIMITEGEKDADLLRNVIKQASTAVTTNPGGAGKWLDNYSLYLAGKDVCIFEDVDDPGRKHSQSVALSIYPYTNRIRIVKPDQFSDVGEWIQKGATEDQIYKAIQAADQYRPPDAVRGYFVGVDTFESITPQEIDWMVEGLIERGSNGIIIAEPKAGKSFLAVDLALHLALGKPWLGFEIPRRVKVGYCAREDNPMLTGRRVSWMRNMLSRENLDEWFYLNTRRQRKTLMLDNNEELSELIHNVKVRGIEFLILDVFNRLHGADENDNSQIRGVLNRVDQITSETGCSVCIIHHTAKHDDPHGSVVSGARGASSLAGFAEFAGRIDVVDHRDRVRRLRWESKSDEETNPIFYRIESNKFEKWIKIKPIRGYTHED